MQQEKSSVKSGKKASNKGEKENKWPGTDATIRVSKKACTKEHCNLCKKHGGAYTTHNRKDYHKYEKGGSKKANFCATRKSGKKPNPIKKSFMQMSKKLEKLEKVIKKQSTKLKKRRRDNSNSDSK